MPQITDPALLAELNPPGAPVRPRTIVVGGADPYKVKADARAESREDRAVGVNEQSNRNTGVSNSLKLAGDYNSDPTVKAYRVAVSQLAQALSTGEGPQADLALTYTFAKAMDPESVVRESEQGMVTNSQPWFQATVEKVKKQFGMDNAGSFTPEARKALRAQIINSVRQRNTGYLARRDYFSKFAQQAGIDPAVIVGQHDGAPFLDKFKEYDESGATSSRLATTQDARGRKLEFQVPAGASDEEILRLASEASGNPAMARSKVNRAQDYENSHLSQGLSGVNEGIASTLGAPVDLVTAGMNLVPQGINAIANTNIPTITDPVLGSEWWKKNPLSFSIGDVSDDPSKKFTRRVGESVGASIIPGGAARSLPGALGVMASGLGGGLGGATAQQVAPGNPMAEIAGELLGGGLTAAGGLGAARRSVTRQIEEAVPTVDALKAQAGELYRQAEARGVTADPAQTQTLIDNLGKTLRDSGQITPAGRLSGVYPKVEAGMKLVEDYSGQPMSPTQLQTVRGVVADGMTSADRSERRLAGQMTENFDDWAAPLAPELPDARNIASRYLAAEQLERARELAGARAGQFTGSGYENALRTEYRGLDRATIKGNSRFSGDVTDAIENVSRGTPGANLARGIGRLAPTGVMSFGLGSGVPGIIAGLSGGLPAAGATILGMSGVGAAGRAIATQAGIRNAGLAELIARNGGKLPEVELLSPEIQQLIAAGSGAQLAKYLPEDNQAAADQHGNSYPNPLAWREGQPKRRAPGSLAGF